MKLTDLESIVGSIGRGQLAKGFEPEAFTTVMPATKKTKSRPAGALVPLPPIAADPAFRPVDAKRQKSAKRHWRKLRAEGGDALAAAVARNKANANKGKRK